MKVELYLSALLDRLDKSAAECRELARVPVWEKCLLWGSVAAIYATLPVLISQYL